MFENEDVKTAYMLSIKANMRGNKRFTLAYLGYVFNKAKTNHYFNRAGYLIDQVAKDQQWHNIHDQALANYK